MAGFKAPNFSDRQKAANDAKANLLKKFQSRPAADDPAVMAREAERAAIAAERNKRQQEREAAKAEQLRLEEEAKAAELARIEREKEEELQKHLALEAEQKAARDARYAARKLRGKKKR